MLEIENVSKSYGDKRALKSTTINIKPGQILGIMGHNGSGKTTLFRLCLGLLRPDSGQIRLNNKQINPIECGYLPEERAVYKDVSVTELITYLAKLKKMKKETIEMRLKYWLEKFKLTEVASVKMGSLSKGNQQKVQFVCALIHNPKLLILDEPLTGLDAANTNLFKEVITNQSQMGKIILLSSHQYEEIEQFCDDVLLLSQGNTVLQGNLDELKRVDKRICVTVKQTVNLNSDQGLLSVKNHGRFTQYCFMNREYVEQALFNVAYDYIKVEPISLRELVGETS